MRPATIPVVMSSMARPFARAMLRAGHNPSVLLTHFGIPSGNSIADDVLISAQGWYDFVQAASDELADPYLGFRTGHEAALGTLPNMKLVDFTSATLGEVLTALVIDASRITTLANYSLSNDGRLARLVSARSFEPAKMPSHMDGFFAGFMLRMLQEYTADTRNPQLLRITVCDPDAIPPDALSRRSVVKGKMDGASFTFPAQWLLARTGGNSRQAGIGADKLNDDFTERLRDILRAHIADPDMTIKKASHLASHSVGKLQSRLSLVGTTYSQELNSIRTTRARELLTSDTLRISSIGVAVGYPDAPSFSRAFERWTGISPREFRKRAKEQ